jgi:flagellin FlaB
LCDTQSIISQETRFAVQVKNEMKKMLRDLLKQKRGMVGIEAAIVLIAFVIVAAAFSFMVVNMGLFATQRGKTTINQGVTDASSPLIVDGNIMIEGQVGDPSAFNVSAMMIPLETIGVNYVPMDQNTTEVSLTVGNHTAIADCYAGVAPYVTTTSGNTTTSTGNPLNSTLSDLVGQITGSPASLGSNNSWAILFIGASNNNTSLDFNEKGYLVFSLANSDAGVPGEHIAVQVRPENSAPMSTDFVVPAQLTTGWMAVQG